MPACIVGAQLTMAPYSQRSSYRDLHALTLVVAAFLVVTALISLIRLLSLYQTDSAIDSAIAGTISRSDFGTRLRAIRSKSEMLQWVSLGVGLVTGGLFLFWVYRAHENLRALGANHFRFSSGGAVGWFFVPIAWYWKPMQAMNDLWRASHSPGKWHLQPTGMLVVSWWMLWVAGWTLSVLIALMRFGNMTEAKLRAIVSLGYLNIGMSLLMSVLAILMILRIAGVQGDNFARGSGRRQRDD